MIYLSHTAVSEVKRLQSKHQPLAVALRLEIQSRGCAGLSYELKFEQQLRPDDQVYECNGVHVAVDSYSLRAVDGLTVDYSEDLMGGGFRFYNPNATQTCSCGNSFATSERL